MCQKEFLAFKACVQQKVSFISYFLALKVLIFADTARILSLVPSLLLCRFGPLSLCLTFKAWPQMVTTRFISL